MQVFVRDNDVEQARRVLKKRMQRAGLFRRCAAIVSMRSDQKGLQERNLKPCDDRASWRANRRSETD